jgi:hypothetical protein
LTGEYGERKVVLENGALFYQRTGPKSTLTPLSETLLAVGDSHEPGVSARPALYWRANSDDRWPPRNVPATTFTWVSGAR